MAAAQVFVLLFLLFPPPEVAATNPDAAPLVQAMQVPTLAICAKDAVIASKALVAKYPGAIPAYACLGFTPGPSKPVKPGLQPDGSVLHKDGSITAPSGPV